jgi:heme oxygenase
MTSKLWNATRDLHHACEQHPVGGVMAVGKPPKIWYRAWLQVLLQLHEVVDQHLPSTVHRVERIQRDISALNITVEPVQAAQQYAATLTNAMAIGGAAYVLTGAHLMGGEIMRRRLEGFPTEHLCWDSRPEALKCLTQLRESPDVIQPARDCFQALLDSMDEILRKYPQELT